MVHRTHRGPTQRGGNGIMLTNTRVLIHDLTGHHSNDILLLGPGGYWMLTITTKSAFRLSGTGDQAPSLYRSGRESATSVVSILCIAAESPSLGEQTQT